VASVVYASKQYVVYELEVLYARPVFTVALPTIEKLKE
jgi:hypothetical protein